MKMAGYTFGLRKPNTDESYPAEIPLKDVAKYIAKKKAHSLYHELVGDEVMLTADTVVIIQQKIIGKPSNREEAIAMLSTLSGKTHSVITGVCVMDTETTQCIRDHTSVTFKTLSQDDIIYYVDHFHPYDKAGGYGVQDWIGVTGIERIEGSYFNVMGLPMHKVYDLLAIF